MFPNNLDTKKCHSTKFFKTEFNPTTVNSTVLFFKVIEIIQTHYSTDYRFKKKTLTDLQLPWLMYYFLHWSLIFLMFSLFWCLSVSSLPWYEISTYHWITYDFSLLEYLNVVNITDGITTTCNVCSKIYAKHTQLQKSEI